MGEAVASPDGGKRFRPIDTPPSNLSGARQHVILHFAYID